MQEAIKHNSFFEPKRKLEHGNVDQAFEDVDNIIKGKLQNTFGCYQYLDLSVLQVPVLSFFHIAMRPEKALGLLEEGDIKPSDVATIFKTSVSFLIETESGNK